MLPWVCSVIDHRRRQNVVRTSVTHSAIASCATFLFLPHFDVICDLLLNRRTATWNLFVKQTTLNHFRFVFTTIFNAKESVYFRGTVTKKEQALSIQQIAVWRQFQLEQDEVSGQRLGAACLVNFLDSNRRSRKYLAKGRLKQLGTTKKRKKA